MFAVFFNSYSVYADEFEQYSNTCKEIGFKPKTPDYGDCVLELRKRDLNNGQKQQKSNSGSSTKQQSNQQQYEMQANEYFQQQQALYDQQMALYQRQKSDYEAQQIALQKEKEKQRWLKLSEFGFRLGAGQSATDAAMATAGMQPLPRPIPPNMQLDQYYRITTPNGGSVNCRYDPKIRTATCY